MCIKPGAIHTIAITIAVDSDTNISWTGHGIIFQVDVKAVLGEEFSGRALSLTASVDPA